ncbi:hypothetical protein GCM10011512_27840 [Tersicoccus solisilvae]|uniref:DUF485 domain-containing protein n=1 Tax=Tersicoccus solisilvae TaxID=1882339 RepID=A0ABQ1PM84_9MICC|nr:hypothetical protein GCM10011512_27840 [Tersicoccus solisilvae]
MGKHRSHDGPDPGRDTDPPVVSPHAGGDVGRHAAPPAADRDTASTGGATGVTPVATGNGADPAGVPEIDFEGVQRDERFVHLRRSHRSFVFPMAAAFLLWYFLYVLLADYAHDFMSTRLAGNITVGLVLGLAQFVTTFAITMGYVAYANRRLDPQAAALRDELEGEDSPYHVAPAGAGGTFDGDVDALAHRDAGTRTARPADNDATREGDPT